MIKMNGKGIGLSKDRVTAYSVGATPARAPASVVSKRKVETAGAGSSVSAAGGANASNADGFLTGILSDQSSQHIKMYRDMYHYDPICGSAVDLQSELPFGDFSLFGVEPKKLEVYESAIASLNMRTAAAQMTRHYLVEGQYASTLVFDPKKTTFSEQIPYAFENLKLEYTPLVSQDPIITAKVDSKFQDFLNNDSPHHQRIRKLIPAPLLNALKQGEFRLDPLSTLFLARRPFLQGEPISYLKRVLPIYLIEKSLYRGTLFEMGRRQRANVHVTAGDDMWEPTPEELNAIANVFQQTDLDPMGAIVVTRNSIQVNEFRQGGDFYKYQDAFDVFTTIKMKGLSISDALLSSEANYSSSDNALVVFMENLNAYRDFFTHTVFTNKLFPLIAMVKGYHKNPSKQEADAAEYSLNIKKANDYSQLDIPQIRWKKRLTAGNDANLFDALEKLSEKGVPVPLRLWLAASGVDAETLLSELGDDKQLQEKFDKLGAHQQQDQKGGGDLMSELSGLRPLGGSSIRGLALRSNDWGNLSDAHVTDSQGRFHHASNQRLAHRRINEQIAKSAARLAERNVYAKVHAALVKEGKLSGKAREL